MKIALIGYGRMGRLVEELALRRGWHIGPKLDIDNNRHGSGITAEAMQGVDAGIDFSQPDAVLANVEAAARAGLHLVVGATGWLDQLDRVRGLVEQSGIGLIYGSNFSLGMNLFFEIVSSAAVLIGKVPQYDAYLEEAHHKGKKDAPSGTALSLREILRVHLGKSDVSVASTRAGFIPGDHIVGFDSESDTIVLEHRARSRQGFAEGALLAAGWISGRKGFYNFREAFPEIAGLSGVLQRN
jgi:4-hydroxy-tetrahydrodipicolinate reductase